MDRFWLISLLILISQISTLLHSPLIVAADIADKTRLLSEAPFEGADESGFVTVNRTCVQRSIGPVASRCNNVGSEDPKSSPLRVALSSMFHACVQFADDPGVRRLRVLAGTARLFAELYRLGSNFSAASGIPLYFNYSTRVGGTGALVRAALARSSIVDTPDPSGGADAFILAPSYMPSFDQAGKLLDLSQLVAGDMQLKWFQIKKFMREQMLVYNNMVVAIPVTSSPVFLLYHAPTFQRDGLEVPRTWDAVITLADKYNGKDINGDGIGDFGICMTPPNCQVDGIILQWIFATFVQTHGPSYGLYLDALTLKNLINSTAMAEALIVLRRLRLAGPRFGDCTAFEDQYYLQGRCLMSISATTTFKLAYAPDAPSAYVAMRGKMGTARFPGSTRVLDRDTGQLVPCNATRCPFATAEALDQDGILRPVNQPTPSNNVVVMINAQSPPKYQFYAYSLFSYLSSPDVLGATGAALLLDPRLESSPLRDGDLVPEAQAQWVAAGYDPTDLALFFTACRAAMDDTNQIFETKFPGNSNITSALSMASIMYTNASIADPPPVSTVVARVVRTMNAVVEQQGGLKAFAPIYRQTLNFVPPEPSSPLAPGGRSGGGSGGGGGSREAGEVPSGLSHAAIVAIAVAVPCAFTVLMAVAVWAFLARRSWHNRRRGFAAAPGGGPDTTLLVTDIQSSTSLWEHLDQEVMSTALSLHNSILRKNIAAFSGYESATEGDSFIVAFSNPTNALLCAVATQQALLDAPWPLGILLYQTLPGLEGDDDPLLPVATISQSKQQQQQQLQVQQQQQLMMPQLEGSSTRSPFTTRPNPWSSSSLIARIRRAAGAGSSKACHSLTPSPSSVSLAPPSAHGMSALTPAAPGLVTSFGCLPDAASAPYLALPPPEAATDPAAVFGATGGAAAAAGNRDDDMLSGEAVSLRYNVLSAGSGEGEDDDRVGDSNSVSISWGGRQASRCENNHSDTPLLPPPTPQSIREPIPRDQAGGAVIRDGESDEEETIGPLTRASRTASELPYVIRPSDLGHSTAGTVVKPTGGPHGSVSSATELWPNTVTLAASILASVRLIKNRAALSHAFTAPTSSNPLGGDNDLTLSRLNQSQCRVQALFPIQPGASDLSGQRQPPLSSESLTTAGSQYQLHVAQRPPSSSAVVASSPLGLSGTVAAGATPLFRGLRVRMGMWTGIPNPADVNVNATNRRTQYSGEAMIYAKLVSDTVHGGMIVLAECSRRRLDPEAIRASCVHLLYAGQHMMAGNNDAPSTPMHLYTCYSQALLPRAVVVRPMRTLAELRPGMLTAPVGHGVVVEMHVVGVSTLLAWNRQVTEASLQLLHDAALKLLPACGRGAAGGTAATHIVVGVESLLDSSAITTGSGSAAALAGGGGEGGTMILVFGDSDGAVAWAAALRRAAKQVHWPSELLEHALAEEVWALAPTTSVFGKYVPAVAANADTSSRLGKYNTNSAFEVGASLIARAVSAVSRQSYFKPSETNYDASTKAQDAPSASRGKLPAGCGSGGGAEATAAAAVAGAGVDTTGAVVSTELGMTAGTGSAAVAAVAASGSHTEMMPAGTDGSTAVRLAAGLQPAPSYPTRAPASAVRMGVTEVTLTPPTPPATAVVPPGSLEFNGVPSKAAYGCEQPHDRAPGFGVGENVTQDSVPASETGARALPLNQRPQGHSIGMDGVDIAAGPERRGLGLAGTGGDALFSMQLLFRGLRLRWGIAAGPLKGWLAPGDLSGQVSYKGKAFAQAAKLASKAKSGQICATMDFARALPAYLLDELTVAEKA
ncbi:hypothetical protein VaNZ11_008730 [Volvox africanus]|uniref:Guanylate cyclase domain-containing protein n=1 Tax=Volvox africanus TaxID=51714 RepID=A0ABQ5S6F0_9CHLO|nr:hypothetical protein VaNZ11_008730 [Volvox africanus]